MLFIKNVKIFDAEFGEHISNFARELTEYKKTVDYDIIGRFNNILIEVTKDMTEEDIINTYRKGI
jgi:hypothetical protein